MKKSTVLILLFCIISGLQAGTMELQTNWGEFKTADQEQVTFTVKASLPEKTENAVWRWKLSDLVGNSIAGAEKKLHAPTGFTERIPVNLPDPGYYRFESEIKDDSGVVHAANFTTVVRLAPVCEDGPKSGFFGTNGHNAVNFVDIMQRVGVRFWRADFDWPKIEPKEGKWNFAETDAIADALAKAKIECVAILGYNPPWIKLEKNTPGATEKYCNYVRKVVERYKDRIRYWDLWNEPQYSWNGDKYLFAEIQKKAYEVIKSIQPDAVVNFNGYPFEEELRGYTREQLNHVGTGVFDAIGLHPYNRPHGPDHNDYLTHAVRIKAWVDANRPGTEVWQSELGWPTSTDRLGVSEELQASYMLRSMIYSLAAGWTRYVQYMPFGGPKMEDSEHQYGLFAWGWRPKISLAAFAHISRLLRSAEFVRMLDLGSTLRGAEFSVPTGSVFCVWAAHDPVVMTWKRPESAAVLTRMDGSIWHEETGDEIFFSENVLFIETADGKTWADALEKGKVKLKEPLMLEMHTIDDGKLRVRLRNRDKISRKVQARITLPDGVRFLNPKLRKQNPANVAFPFAGQVKELRLNLDMPKRKIVDDKVQIRLTGAGFQSNFSIPLQQVPAFHMPEYAVDAKPGKWNDYPALTFNTVQAIAPADLQLKWKGPEDLSIRRAHYGWNEQGVILYIEVLDSIHQPLPREISDWNLWRYDAVQYTFNATPKMPATCYDQFTTEVGVGLRDGKCAYHVYLGNTVRPVKAACRRDEKTHTTIYDILTPWSMFGLNQAPAPGTNISACFIVNDNDEGRNGVRKYMEMSPGIGMTKDPSLYRRLILEP